ncbi:MAG: hypothetical protein ACTSUK_10125 [Promethearchaeota archaeon]
MLFLIDTCFWLHVQTIYRDLKIDLRILLKHFRWGYTEQILQEYKHYHLQNFVPLSDGYQIPFSNQELKKFQEKYSFIREFDISDQTLVACAKRDSAIILTDDGGLLMEIQSWEKMGLCLPAFCLWAVKKGLIRKNTMIRLLRFWENNHLFEKREIKRWKNELQQVR